MPRPSNPVNVALDDEHSTKLRRLAERTNTNPGTIARSLLATALDDADPDARPEGRPAWSGHRGRGIMSTNTTLTPSASAQPLERAFVR